MNQQARRIRPFAAGLNIKDFLAFHASRPDEERWELIEGVAVMMSPPTLAHNRIASNLAMALNLSFRRTRAPLFCYTDSGVQTPGVSNYMPRPDVMVAANRSGYDISSHSYRLAAEVLSPSNSKRDVRLKLRHYKEHPGNEFVLIIDSRKVSLELHARAANWEPAHFTKLHDSIELASLGAGITLAELYEGTPLEAI